VSQQGTKRRRGWDITREMPGHTLFDRGNSVTHHLPPGSGIAFARLGHAGANELFEVLVCCHRCSSPPGSTGPTRHSSWQKLVNDYNN
jgi:hypothetical protein